MDYNGNVDVFYGNCCLKEGMCSLHPKPDEVKAKILLINFCLDKVIWSNLVS